MKKIIISLALVSGFVPAITLAYTFRDMVDEVVLDGIFTPLIAILSSLVIIVFVWGILKFMKNTDSKEREEGKSFMFWGIIGIFVMVSVWGLVGIIQNSFDLNNDRIDIPDVNNLIR